MRSALLLLLFATAAVGCRFEARPAAEDPSLVTAEAPGLSGEFSDSVVNTTTPDGKPAVVLYVTEWCPYCAQAREFMAAENIPHEVIDIEKDAAGAAAYQALGGTGGIPLVAVGQNTIQGWSEAAATQMLTEAGYK
jgi:glutaredoxin